MDSSIEHQRTVRFMAGTLADEAIERWHQSKFHCRAMVTPKPVHMLTESTTMGQMLLWYLNSQYV